MKKLMDKMFSEIMSIPKESWEIIKDNDQKTAVIKYKKHLITVSSLITHSETGFSWRATIVHNGLGTEEFDSDRSRQLWLKMRDIAKEQYSQYLKSLLNE